MLRRLRNAVQQKGQGIVEYALLLAFVVGIAMLLNSSNIGGAVKGVFDDVVTVFSDVKDYASALEHWGNMSKEELSKVENEKRLSIDQEAMANLAGYFIGLTKADLYPLFTRADTVWSNKVILLGHLTNNENGGMSFVANGDSISDTGKGELEAHIYNWLQQDYGKDGVYDSSKDYNPETRYLFSDYALGNDTGSTFKAADNKTYDRGGIKIKLLYDNSDKVVAAKVVMDSFNNSGSAGANSSKGLSVTKIGNLPATYNDDFDTNFNKNEVLKQLNN